MIDLSGIVSISGQPGLFKVVSQTKFGLLVEQIGTGKKMPAYAHQKISALADISMFSIGDDVPLNEVYMKIFTKENGGKAIDAKSDNKLLINYFKEVFPDYDQERVYTSDIKKAIQWYNILQENNLLKIKEDKKQDTTPEEQAKA
jgi:hypothetical protein